MKTIRIKKGVTLTIPDKPSKSKKDQLEERETELNEAALTLGIFAGALLFGIALFRSIAESRVADNKELNQE